MRTLRALYKSLALISLLCLGAALWAAGLLWAGWSPALRWRWRCWALRQWARATAALLGMRLQTSGAAAQRLASPARPSLPSLIIANHLSYLDVLVLAQHCDAVFVAKSEIARWPLLGVLSRWMGTIFLERQRPRALLRVNALIERSLRAGQSVIIFLEGTTSPGFNVLPFKSSLLEPALRLGLPVRHASLHYATPAPKRRRPWPFAGGVKWISCRICGACFNSLRSRPLCTWASNG